MTNMAMQIAMDILMIRTSSTPENEFNYDNKKLELTLDRVQDVTVERIRYQGETLKLLVGGPSTI